MKSSPITLETVRQAQARIADGLRLTPCAYSSSFSEISGMSIFCKRDFEQVTGSFKERGARNALLSLTSAQRTRGVVAASAGNHALGLAYHGGLLGIAVTVVMPKSAPRVKAERCRDYGARVVLHGGHFADAAAHAHQLECAEGATFVHPFEDDAVIAGQATLALEVLNQVPELDALVVAVGGGGLLAGTVTVLKSLKPEVEVIGVEPAHAAGLFAALQVGRPVPVPLHPTLADGLAVDRVGDRTFALVDGKVNCVVTVTEDDLALAMLEYHEREYAVIEGAGAAALAACLSRKLPHLLGKRVVVSLCGRNVDPAVHARALWRAKGLRAEEEPAPRPHAARA